MRQAYFLTLADLVRNNEHPLVTCASCGRRTTVDVQRLAKRVRDPEKVTMTQLMVRLKCSKCGSYADPVFKIVPS